VKARYVAERHEIAARHSIWEITGPPQVRDVDPERRHLCDRLAGTVRLDLRTYGVTKRAAGARASYFSH
jgi:hypothetical protein